MELGTILALAGLIAFGAFLFWQHKKRNSNKTTGTGTGGGGGGGNPPPSKE